MPRSAEGPPQTSPTRSGLPSCSAAGAGAISLTPGWETTARSGDANRPGAVAGKEALRGATGARGAVVVGEARRGSRRGWAREGSMRSMQCGGEGVEVVIRVDQ